MYNAERILSVIQHPEHKRLELNKKFFLNIAVNNMNSTLCSNNENVEFSSLYV